MRRCPRHRSGVNISDKAPQKMGYIEEGRENNGYHWWKQKNNDGIKNGGGGCLIGGVGVGQVTRFGAARLGALIFPYFFNMGSPNPRRI